MKALVTGSSGFLGSHIVDHLKLAGFEVVAFDLKKPHRKDLEFVVSDVRDKEAVMKAAKGCNYIFHNAAIANIDDSYKAPFETMGVNVTGTLTLLEAARVVGVKRFVLASSVYVSSNMGSLYRVSKIASELLCETYEREFGITYTLIRYGSLYGRRSNTWNMVFDICTKLLEKGEYTYKGTGEEIREFINVEDAAREISRVLKSGGKAVFVEPLAHNPISNMWRRLTPMARTSNEWPLSYSEISEMGKQFSSVKYQEFALFTLLSSFVYLITHSHKTKKRSAKILDKLDHVVLKVCKPLRRYSGAILIEFTK